MKKLLLISIGAVLLSACSSSNQISLTQSRYGNGIGIAFGDGITKEDQAKTDHFRQVVRERVQHRKFMQAINLDQRKIELINSELNTNQNPDFIELKNTYTPEKIKEDLNDFSTTRDISTSSIDIKNTSTQIENGLKPQSLRKSKKALRVIEKESKKGLMDSDIALLILVILALIIPPLAVYLFEGSLTNRFWLSLILTLLFWIPGVIYALIVILGG